MIVAPVAAAVVLVVPCWAVIRYWVPGGRVVPTARRAAARSGLSRRAALGASVLLALGAGGSLLGVDGVGLGWALATGLYGGGIGLLATAASNRTGRCDGPRRRRPERSRRDQSPSLARESPPARHSRRR